MASAVVSKRGSSNGGRAPSQHQPAPRRNAPVPSVSPVPHQISRSTTGLRQSSQGGVVHASPYALATLHQVGTVFEPRVDRSPWAGFDGSDDVPPQAPSAAVLQAEPGPDVSSSSCYPCSHRLRTIGRRDSAYDPAAVEAALQCVIPYVEGKEEEQASSLVELPLPCPLERLPDFSSSGEEPNPHPACTAQGTGASHYWGRHHTACCVARRHADSVRALPVRCVRTPCASKQRTVPSKIALQVGQKLRDFQGMVKVAGDIDTLMGWVVIYSKLIGIALHPGLRTGLLLRLGYVCIRQMAKDDAFEKALSFGLGITAYSLDRKQGDEDYAALQRAISRVNSVAQLAPRIWEAARQSPPQLQVRTKAVLLRLTTIKKRSLQRRFTSSLWGSR